MFTKKDMDRFIRLTDTALRQALQLLPITDKMSPETLKDSRVILQSARGHFFGQHEYCAQAIEARERIRLRHKPGAPTAECWCGGLDPDTRQVCYSDAALAFCMSMVLQQSCRYAV